MRLSAGPVSATPILCEDSETFGINVHPMVATATPCSKRRRYAAVIVVPPLPGPSLGPAALEAWGPLSWPDALSGAFPGTGSRSRFYAAAFIAGTGVAGALFRSMKGVTLIA